MKSSNADMLIDAVNTADEITQLASEIRAAAQHLIEIVREDDDNAG